MPLALVDAARARIGCASLSSCPASVAATVLALAPSSASASSSAARPRFRPDSSAASILTSNQDSIECDTNCTDTMKIDQAGQDADAGEQQHQARHQARAELAGLVARVQARQRDHDQRSAAAPATAAFRPSSQE